MKILFFNWRDITHPWAGGAEKYVHEIGKRLAENHEVSLYCSGYDGCKERDELDGMQIIRRGGRFSVYFYTVFDYLFKLRKENYDVIVDCINGVPFFTPLFIRKPRVAIIHQIMGVRIIFRELPFYYAIIAWIAERTIPFLYRRTPVVTVSESSKAELTGFGIPVERVIYNSIDHGTFRPDIKDRNPLIVYLSRLKRYKRPHHLLKAFIMVRKKIPEARLIFAGRGNYSRLEMLVKEMDLDGCVNLLGEVSEADKRDILQRAWVLVNPSIKEGWGIVVSEANACGTPAIAYDVPGLRDSIRDGETGLLATDGDIADLANTIVRVLSDEALRNRLSQNALKAASTLSWDESACQLLELLDSLSRKANIEP